MKKSIEQIMNESGFKREYGINWKKLYVKDGIIIDEDDIIIDEDDIKEKNV